MKILFFMALLLSTIPSCNEKEAQDSVKLIEDGIEVVKDMKASSS